jgi:transformation/transcription domain-associated protein
MKIYQEITSLHVPDSLLSSYIHSTVTTLDDWWNFRIQYSKHTGLTGFLSHLFKIGDRSPSKISLFQANGRVMNNEFFPSYNVDSVSDNSNEMVPFRLTRNIQNFLSPMIIEGVIGGSLGSFNQLLYQQQDILKHSLYLFFRDDLVSWESAKRPFDNDQQIRLFEKQIRERVNANAVQFLKKIHLLIPNPQSTQPLGFDVNNKTGGQGQGGPGQQGIQIPINAKVLQLIKIAMAKTKICSMQPTWAPWF